jgi:glycosyltransferase involved in cell wall biosynthesis
MSQRPLIIYLGKFLIPNRNAACTRAIGNAKVFNELGYDVDVVGFERLPNHHRKQYFLERGTNLFSAPDRKEGILAPFTSFRINPFSAIHHIESRMRSGQVACVVCYNYPSLAQALIQVWCKANKIGFVSDITEWQSEPTGISPKEIFRFLDANLRVQLLSRVADGVIVTSKMVENYFRQDSNKPIANIPTLFDKDELEFHQKPQTNQNSPIRLLFLGPGFDLSMDTAPPEKMKERIDLVIETILEVHRAGNKIKLDVFGISSKQFFGAVNIKKTDVAEINSIVEFHGRVPHTDIISMLKRCDFSIFFRDNKPSNNAGFPTKFAESLMTGTPVIIDNIMTLQPYYKNEHVLQLDRTNPKDMANQLIEKVADYRRHWQTQTPDAPAFQLFHYMNFIEEMKKVFPPVDEEC